MSVQGDASMQNETQGEWPAEFVCVCVFLSPCRSSEATFCPFKAVSDWPLSPSLSLSLYLSLSLAFFPLYISSLSFHFSPHPNPTPSSFSSFVFPFRLSPISSSALQQEPIHISHLTPYWAWKSHFSLTKWRNLSTGRIILLVSNANQFASRIFLHSSATLKSSLIEVTWSAFSRVSWQGFYVEDIHDKKVKLHWKRGALSCPYRQIYSPFLQKNTEN